MRYVPIDSVEPGMVLGKNIIRQARLPVIRKGLVLSENYIDYFDSQGYRGLYVMDRFSEAAKGQDCISEDLFKTCVEAVERADVDALIRLASELVTEISQLNSEYIDMFDMRSYENYVCHHSVCVAVYSIKVGIEMGLWGGELQNLAIAALCHDLGQLSIPDEILNKPGKLTDKEFELIKSHCRLSADKLDKVEIPSAVRVAVLFHHENENGSGYPMGRLGDQIPLLAKIIHTVDVYDALTNRKPYKETYSPLRALNYLQDGCGVLFDKSVVDTVKKVIPTYPIGSMVLLSNGETGLVTAYTDCNLRPVVKIQESNAIADLSNDSDYMDVRIVKSAFLGSGAESDKEAIDKAKSGARTKETILLIDSNKMSLLQTKEALKDEYQVFTSISGLEAFTCIRENGYPDLIISDTRMPQLDGFTIIKTLQENGMENVPFIFLASEPDYATVIRSKELGAADFIIKPAAPEYLKERVLYALKKTRD